MPNRGTDRARALLAPDEIRIVSELFQAPAVIRAHAYNRGSVRFPKAIIETADRARFLLKRRIETPSNIARVNLSHEVQVELARTGFPVSTFKRTNDDATWVVHDGCIYEMFTFIDGDRFGRLEPEVHESGILLSRMHWTLKDWEPSTPTPSHAGYHNSQPVGSSWSRLETKILEVDPAASTLLLEKLVANVRDQYEMAAVTAENTLVDSSACGSRSILHGDLHPGNMLFGARRPIALLDFDSARIGRTLFDIANGALQFSMPSMGKKPVVDWDASLNIELFKSFLSGYAWMQHMPLDESECGALPALMIEATVAETIPRIALGGTWEGRSGIEILEFVWKRAQWIWSQRSTLTTLCQSCMRP